MHTIAPCNRRRGPVCAKAQTLYPVSTDDLGTLLAELDRDRMRWQRPAWPILSKQTRPRHRGRVYGLFWQSVLLQIFFKRCVKLRLVRMLEPVEIAVGVKLRFGYLNQADGDIGAVI